MKTATLLESIVTTVITSIKAKTKVNLRFKEAICGFEYTFFHGR